MIKKMKKFKIAEAQTTNNKTYNKILMSISYRLSHRDSSDVKRSDQIQTKNYQPDKVQYPLRKLSQQRTFNIFLALPKYSF